MAVERKSWTRNTLLLVALAIAAAFWLIPFAFLILTSLRAQGELLSDGVFSWPRELRWTNFAAAWNVGNFSTYFANSAFVVALKVPVGILVAALAAYPLAKMKFAGERWFFTLFLIGLAVPMHVTLLPLAQLSQKLGLSDTLWALLPPYIAFGLPFQILVLRGFFRTVPTALVEAARLDGCSELGVFFRVMLPVSKPALATLLIIDVVGTWNELIIALVLLSSETSRTVPLGLLTFQGQFGVKFAQLSAAIVIGIAPMVIVYVIFQRHLIAGMTAGALKE
ncbi:MAG: carbohydrate ABC transporter permease [Deltaproteobacteria bacterium]|nr:carbohydrate ABC transporter permease [Deltaproteobacteria bacterium]